jgi:hypothetical protein
MPVDLCNAPATLERLMETVLRGLTYDSYLVYLDDVIVIGRMFENTYSTCGKSSSGSEKPA